MFHHAWQGYRKGAFGHDEVHPVTNKTNDSWGGFGITLIDSLDTMALLKMTDSLEEAREFVSKISYDKDYDASFFETTIRHLGGLLGAYEITEDTLYLDKAIDVGQRLLHSFSSPTGIPYSIVNLRTGKAKNHQWTNGYSILSEVGSVQLEFKALSFFTGDSRFRDASQKVMEILDSLPRKHAGLFPQFVNNNKAVFGNEEVTYGGLSDSFYEYLLKQWIQGGKKDPKMLQMYQDSVRALRNYLIQRTFVPIYNSEESHPHYYIAQWSNGRAVPVMEHLACFTPGMLALGHYHGAGYVPGVSQNNNEDGDDVENNEKNKNLRKMDDLELAKELLHTCVDLYLDQETGLGPESVRFHERGEHDNKKAWYSVESASYFLRPETLESLYLLYAITGDPEYQDLGWQIFKAIETHCKTDIAYSAVHDVTAKKPVWSNSMQSFFFAETIKYLYLLFSPPQTFDLNSRVFTTEAHPLPVFS